MDSKEYLWTTKNKRIEGFDRRLTNARRNAANLDASPVDGRRRREEFPAARLGEAEAKRIWRGRWEEPNNFRRRHGKNQWKVVLCLA
jgi:hypothetical protein